MYIHQQPDWPNFRWDSAQILAPLASVRGLQGRLLGYMSGLGFQLMQEASINTLTLNILKSSEIEGEILDKEQVRSSIARHLGLEQAGLLPFDRHIDGIVEMMLDATRNYAYPLSEGRLWAWHKCMFPEGKSGLYKIATGQWRTSPMAVVSGGMGYERVHFEAPEAPLIGGEMAAFMAWFNEESIMEPVLKAGVAHLWFLTIHPFDDGNGRIGRAIADMMLGRGDQSPQRFYSMSAQIQRERNSYYQILEATQKAGMDITLWLQWWLACVERALNATDDVLANVLIKAKFWEQHGTKALNARQKRMLNKLFDGFDGKLTTEKWAKIAKCSHDTALRDISDLIELGILEKDIAGGRSTSYSIKAEVSTKQKY